MSKIIPILICIIVGYLIGGINPAYIISRLRGFDIRKRGSGNAGASNAMITMGKAVGVFSGLFDIAKAALCVLLARVLFPNIGYAAALAGGACIFGHIFPVTMGFHGGKGLACLGGMILAYNPFVFIIALAIELVLVLIIDYICVVPITASIAFPFINFAMTRDPVTTVIYCLPPIVMLFKHIENLKRIHEGKEVHFSYLWKGKKELDRVGLNEQSDEEK